MHELSAERKKITFLNKLSFKLNLFIKKMEIKREISDLDWTASRTKSFVLCKTVNVWGVLHQKVNVSAIVELGNMSSKMKHHIDISVSDSSRYELNLRKPLMGSSTGRCNLHVLGVARCLVQSPVPSSPLVLVDVYTEGSSLFVHGFAEKAKKLCQEREDWLKAKMGLWLALNWN